MNKFILLALVFLGALAIADARPGNFTEMAGNFTSEIESSIERDNEVAEVSVADVQDETTEVVANADSAEEVRTAEAVEATEASETAETEANSLKEESADNVKPEDEEKNEKIEKVEQISLETKPEMKQINSANNYSSNIILITIAVSSLLVYIYY